VKLKPGLVVDASALETLITAAYVDAGMRLMFANETIERAHDDT
jgi:hypothetical protein